MKKIKQSLEEIRRVVDFIRENSIEDPDQKEHIEKKLNHFLIFQVKLIVNQINYLTANSAPEDRPFSKFSKEAQELIYKLPRLRNYLVHCYYPSEMDSFFSSTIPEFITEHLKPLLLRGVVPENPIYEIELNLKTSDYFKNRAHAKSSTDQQIEMIESEMDLLEIVLEGELVFDNWSSFLASLECFDSQQFRESSPLDWDVMQNCLEVIVTAIGSECGFSHYWPRGSRDMMEPIRDIRHDAMHEKGEGFSTKMIQRCLQFVFQDLQTYLDIAKVNKLEFELEQALKKVSSHSSPFVGKIVSGLKGELENLSESLLWNLRAINTQSDRIFALESALDSQVAEISNLRVEKRELSSLKGSFVQQMGDLRKKYAERKQQLNLLIDENESLRHKLDRYELAQIENSRLFKEKCNEARELNTELENLRFFKLQSIKISDELNSQNRALEQKIKNHRVDKASLDSRIQALSEEIEDYQADEVSLTTRVEDLLKEVQELTEQKDDFSNQNAFLIEENEQLSEQNAELLGRLAVLENALPEEGEGKAALQQFGLALFLVVVVCVYLMSAFNQEESPSLGL